MGIDEASELNITERLPSYKPVRKIWSQTWLPDTRVWPPETRLSMLFLAEFLIAWKDWEEL